MSDFQRPDGDHYHDDDDLPQDHWADVSPDDADALDAMLNEIAMNDGTPGTRSGDSRNRPDARTDPDHGNAPAESLAATAASFHRRIELAQSRNTRAASPDSNLWETIMQKAPPPTLATLSATVGNPWTAGTASQPQRAKPSRAARVARRQQTWNMIANVALIAAILLSGFGIWRYYGGPSLPGGSSAPPAVPGVAMQPSALQSTPNATEQTGIAVPPRGTPQPTTACDFSADIPIFNGLDESPWDGTAVLLTTSGDVVLTCPEESEDQVLMTTSSNNSISPLGWPGTVLIPSYGEKPEEARSRVLNLMTGEIVEFGVPVGAMQIGTEGAEGSPWLIGPAADDTSDIQILDLRTMSTKSLSDITGANLPEYAGMFTSGSTGNGTFAFGLHSPHNNDGNGTIIAESEMPGDLLVLQNDIASPSWISVPSDFPPVTNITVSPDGKHVALHGVTDQMSPDQEDVFSIVRVSDGKEVDRSATFSDGPEIGEGLWVRGGKAFAYISGSALKVLPIDPTLPDQPIFQGNSPLIELRVTTDDRFVIVEEELSNDLPTVVADGEQVRFFQVDAATGEAVMLTGIDINNALSIFPYPDRFLVTYQPKTDLGDTITYDVIDAVTMERIDTLDDIPLDDSGISGYPNIAYRAVMSSPDGTAEIVSFDSQHTFLMRVVDGQPQVQELAPPEGILSDTPMPISMGFSPNGTFVTMTGQNDESGSRYILDVTAASPTWQAIPAATGAGSWIGFVPGTNAIPEAPVDTGFDFSEVPPGEDFLKHDQLAESLLETEDKFVWPTGYDPDVEAVVTEAPDEGRYQDGMAYTVLGIYNKCAWQQTWLDAFEQGDEEMAAEALQVMTDIFPTFPNQDVSVVDALDQATALAAEGDPSMVQQMVTVGCQDLYWE